MGLSLNGGNVPVVFHNGGNGCLNAPGDIRLGHGGRGGGPVYGLAGDKGHVHKAALHARIVLCQGVQHTVHQVIAHEGSGGIGHAGRKSRLPDFGHHGLDGQGGEIGGGAVFKDGHIDGLVALVIGNAGIVHIDGHPLGGQIIAAAGLADAQHRIRLLPLDGRRHGFDGLAKHGGHLQLDDLHTRDLTNQFYGFQGGIDGRSAKGIKGSQKQFHKITSKSLIERMQNISKTREDGGKTGICRALPANYHTGADGTIDPCIVCRKSECHYIHQNDVDDQHHQRHGNLREDDGILALGFQQSGGHDVEVCCHGGHQGAAVTGGETQRTHNHGVGTLGNQEGDADAHGNHGEGGEAVAHDDGEQCHGNAVYGAGGQLVALRHNGADTGGNHGAHTGGSEQGAQSGQNLGQQTGGSHIIQQTGAVAQGGAGLFLEQAQGYDQGDHSRDTDGVVGAQALPEGGNQNRHNGQGQGGDEHQVAELVGVLAGGFCGGNIAGGLSYLAAGGQAGHDHHTQTGDPLGHIGARDEGKGGDEPEGGGAHPGLEAGILQSLHTVEDKHKANNAVEYLGDNRTHGPGHVISLPFWRRTSASSSRQRAMRRQRPPPRK